MYSVGKSTYDFINTYLIKQLQFHYLLNFNEVLPVVDYSLKYCTG